MTLICRRAALPFLRDRTRSYEQLQTASDSFWLGRRAGSKADLPTVKREPCRDGGNCVSSAGFREDRALFDRVHQLDGRIGKP